MHRVTPVALALFFITSVACSSETESSAATDTSPVDGGTDAAANAADVPTGGSDSTAGVDAGGSADAGSADVATAADTNTGINWESMSFSERQKYMQTTVEPTMRKLFQAFDAKRYANFGCNTCHGKNQAAVASQMPNTLTGLNPGKMPDPNSSNAYEAKFAKFMGTEVLPTMMTLLNSKPFDPATGKGMRCFSCHTTLK